MEEGRGHDTRKEVSAHQVTFRQNSDWWETRIRLGLSDGKVTHVRMHGSSFSVCFCHEDRICMLLTYVNKIIAKIKSFGQLFPKSRSERLEPEAVVQIYLCEATSSCLTFGFTRLLFVFFLLC